MVLPKCARLVEISMPGLGVGVKRAGVGIILLTLRGDEGDEYVAVAQADLLRLYRSGSRGHMSREMSSCSTAADAMPTQDWVDGGVGAQYIAPWARCISPLPNLDANPAGEATVGPHSQQAGGWAETRLAKLCFGKTSLGKTRRQ